jgi:hypothetical protein
VTVLENEFIRQRKEIRLDGTNTKAQQPTTAFGRTANIFNMWNCKKCGEKMEDQFESCWKCSAPKTDVETDAAANQSGRSVVKKPWRFAYKYFRGTWSTWDDLFSQAAQFATEIGPERVVGISHSADKGDGVVTVWYWTQEDEAENA